MRTSAQRSRSLSFLYASARSFSIALVIVLVLLIPIAATAQEDISVRLQVESRTVYMGESFLVQIVVDGSDSAEQPDLSAVEDFSVEYLGGSNNSSQSITIINGKLERVVQRGFIFSYRFTPTRVGTLVVPQIIIKMAGKSYRTVPLTIEVTKPGETEEFKLRIRLSRETCYVGEPVTLDVVWYLRRDVQDFRFTAPLLGSDDFDFSAPEVQIDNSKRYYRIPLGGGEIIAEKGRGMLEGVTYATLTFRIAMIPKRPGSFVIPEFIVACESASGRISRRDFFDDFFRDDFFSFRRGEIEKYVVPSNKLSLLVRDLPSEGRSPGFAGHVGEYRIGASAEPAEVNIGDPITLTVTIEGPDYLEHINMPPLQDQALLARDFKIPEERADGTIQGKKKVFTQTIRARSEEIDEIPSIELAYFDTKEGRYRTARSEPIPIKVNPTRVVTASDAEGIEAAPLGAPVEQWREGIAYNFEGSSVLEPQEYGILSVVTKPGWLAVILISPAFYGAFLSGVLLIRRRRSDPAAKRARGALKRLERRLGEASKVAARGGGFQEQALEALRNYLGDKLDRTGATITAIDIERVFVERGVPDKLTGALLEILHALEAGAYAGTAFGPTDPQSLTKRIVDSAKRIDRIM
jgi:hypothetical protein